MSNQGRVRSVDRIVEFADGHSRRYRGRVIKQSVNVGESAWAMAWRTAARVPGSTDSSSPPLSTCPEGRGPASEQDQDGLGGQPGGRHRAENEVDNITQEPARRSQARCAAGHSDLDPANVIIGPDGRTGALPDLQADVGARLHASEAHGGGDMTVLYQPLIDIVAVTAYRPCWEIEVDEDYIRGDSRGPTLVIRAFTQDTYNPTTTLRVNHWFLIPEVDWNRRTWLIWLFRRLLDVEYHETGGVLHGGREASVRPGARGGGQPLLLLRGAESVTSAGFLAWVVRELAGRLSVQRTPYDDPGSTSTSVCVYL